MSAPAIPLPSVNSVPRVLLHDHLLRISVGAILWVCASDHADVGVVCVLCKLGHGLSRKYSRVAATVVRAMGGGFSLGAWGVKV